MDRTACPKFGHPAQTSDIYFSNLILHFCTGKYEKFRMDRQFKIVSALILVACLLQNALSALLELRTLGRVSELWAMRRRKSVFTFRRENGDIPPVWRYLDRNRFIQMYS